MSNPLFILTTLQPSSLKGRLSTQASRTTPPHILQQGVLNALQKPPHQRDPAVNIASAVNKGIAKVELHALDANDQMLEDVGKGAPGWIRAHLNPTDLERTIKTEWTEVKVPGLSHPIIHYSGTEAQVVKLSLFFDAFMFVDLLSKEERKKDPLAYGAAEIAKAHRFLEACHYARSREADGPIDGAPPRLFFHWPNAFALRCVLESVSFKYLLFAPTGEIIRFTADIQLKEIRDERLTYEAAAADGARRFTAASRPSSAGAGDGGSSRNVA